MKLDHVSFKHEEWVLQDVTFDVPEGARVAILGANGSGKSTLLKLMAGAWRPTSGTVYLSGAPMDYSRKGRNRTRSTVQLVLQEPDEQLFATSVVADVSYGPVNLGATDVDKRVAEAMALTGITELADRVPHRLSYGQRKQVALAGALAMRPELLLLDEPTAGLDPASCAGLLDVLANLDTSIVLTTHDVDFAWAFATHIGVIVDGTVVFGRSQLLDPALLERARLTMPWSPVVSQIVGKTVNRPEELL